MAYTWQWRQRRDSADCPKATTDLVEVEHQVQLAHVSEEGIQNFDEEVNGLQKCKLIVVGVDAGAEEQACVPPVDDLGRVPELDKVGLVFLVARRNQAMDLAFQLDLVLILCPGRLAAGDDDGSRLARTLYGAYHLASRVFPLQRVSCRESGASRADVLAVLYEDEGQDHVACTGGSWCLGSPPESETGSGWTPPAGGHDVQMVSRPNQRKLGRA